MSSSTVKKGTVVIAGVGNGTGTGASTARLFGSRGYNVALIARRADDLEAFAKQLRSESVVAEAFPIKEYSHAELASVFKAIETKWPAKEGGGIRVGLWNAGQWLRKPFLEIEEDEVQTVVQTNIVGAFAFSKEAIGAILSSTSDSESHRGTLLFTGATASLRGGQYFSGFAAGKFGIRALSQSLAREFGKQGVHVAHSVIDGGIVTDRSRANFGPGFEEKIRSGTKVLTPEAIAKAYWYLHEQDTSAWTLELDLRPAHENF